MELRMPFEFCKADSGAIRFFLKCPWGGAVLSLTSKEKPQYDLYVIALGDVTVIKDVENDKETRENTPSITDSDEFREFWVTWFDNVISVGLVGETQPLITHEYTKNGDEIIGYVKFYRMVQSEVLDWILDKPPLIPTTISHKHIEGGNLIWKEMENSQLPKDALIGGFEKEPIYIARSRHNGSLCPGKYVPSKGAAFVPWGHREHKKTKFEILCGYNAAWIKTKKKFIPQNAFIGGHSEVRGEPLYIGRAMHEGNLLTGKIHLLYSTCYLPYKGKEVEFSTYEVLVLSDRQSRGIENFDEIPTNPFPGSFQ